MAPPRARVPLLLLCLIAATLPSGKGQPAGRSQVGGRGAGQGGGSERGVGVGGGAAAAQRNRPAGSPEQGRGRSPTATPPAPATDSLVRPCSAPNALEIKIPGRDLCACKDPAISIQTSEGCECNSGAGGQRLQRARSGSGEGVPPQRNLEWCTLTLQASRSRGRPSRASAPTSIPCSRTRAANASLATPSTGTPQRRMARLLRAQSRVRACALLSHHESGRRTRHRINIVLRVYGGVVGAFGRSLLTLKHAPCRPVVPAPRNAGRPMHL